MEKSSAIQSKQNFICLLRQNLNLKIIQLKIISFLYYSTPFYQDSDGGAEHCNALNWTALGCALLLATARWVGGRPFCSLRSTSANFRLWRTGRDDPGSAEQGWWGHASLIRMTQVLPWYGHQDFLPPFCRELSSELKTQPPGSSGWKRESISACHPPLPQMLPPPKHAPSLIPAQ